MAVYSSAHDGRQQSGLKSIDLRARVAQAGQFDDRLGADAQMRASGQAQQLDAAGGDVLAELARRDREASCRQCAQQFGVEQMHLAQVGLQRVARYARAMLHGTAAMRVALDAEPASSRMPGCAILLKRCPPSRCTANTPASSLGVVMRSSPPLAAHVHRVHDGLAVELANAN